MNTRRIITVDGTRSAVAEEAVFDSEQFLHQLIAAHPEVLPTDDLGLGQLATIASEFDVGDGSIDMLAADATGRLAIIEFKRGTENPDVRKVVAQMLDYGSRLWRLPYDELELRARSSQPGFSGLLAQHVGQTLQTTEDISLDEDAFVRGAQATLETGDFAFIYVGRRLDDRSRRIMQFLAEGPRMTFFPVEVDFFRTSDGSSVLVPRTSFVPTWVNSSPSSSADQLSPEDASSDTQLLVQRLDELSSEIDMASADHRRTRSYGPAPDTAGISLYFSRDTIDFDLNIFRRRSQDDVADRLQEKIALLAEKTVAPYWPNMPCKTFVARWGVAQELVREYMEARRGLSAKSNPPSSVENDSAK